MKLAQRIYKERDSLFFDFVKEDEIIHETKIGDLASLALPMVLKVFILYCLGKLPSHYRNSPNH